MNRAAARAAAIALLGALACALVPVRAGAEVTLNARLDRDAIAGGETTTLEITVEGSGSVSDPEVPLPPGVQAIGSSRSQSFSWVNGRSSTQVLYRIELAAAAAGTYTIGPVRVRAGGQVLQSPALALTVTASRPRAPAGGGGGGRAPVLPGGARAAELVVDVSPREPYVGQPVLLRVRLVDRVPLAEDPQYTPPATPGFWAEKSSQPTSYYADGAGGRVLVTETRTRLYPLAAGTARVGEATAVVALALPGNSFDPFGLFSGMTRRVLELRSVPVVVRVRPLPGGAPAAFDGAVGRFTVSWRADRADTPRDVPVTVSLDVRGLGNLPLLHTPVFTTRDADVFSSIVQDSLGAPGTMVAGRRRFQWTVLPRSTGTLQLAAPVVAWFDDAAGRYVTSALPPIEIRVSPPTGGHAREAGAFPGTFADRPLDPARAPGRAWSLALAGALAALAIDRVRRARRAPGAAATPAWHEGLRHARGASFWAAAGRAVDELAARGVDVTAWKRDVDAARYGGGGAGEDRLRDELLARLAGTTPRAGAGRAGALALAGAASVLALAAVAFGLPSGGGADNVRAGLQADTQARRGDIDGATRLWEGLWRGGGRAPALAARLAWAAARRGDVAVASAWVLRGDRGEPRDPALKWARGQVRDAGGLEGWSPVRWPVRTIEWGALALLAALACAWAPQRARGPLLALAVLLAVAPSVDAWRATQARRAVVLAPVSLGGQGVDLAAGQVVRVLGTSGRRARVEAGPGVAGDVAADSLIMDGRP